VPAIIFRFSLIDAAASEFPFYSGVSAFGALHMGGEVLKLKGYTRLDEKSP
jgi:hypothetical protein